MLASLPATTARIAYLARLQQRRVAIGDAIGRIEIPKVGVFLHVVEGTNAGSLEERPGRYPSTAFPGLGRTVAIAGHRTTYLGPFRWINELGPGDRIILTMPYGRFTYIVQKKPIVVLPTAWWITRNVGYERLVLSACQPLYSASHRIVVFAGWPASSREARHDRPPTPPSPLRGAPSRHAGHAAARRRERASGPVHRDTSALDPRWRSGVGAVFNGTTIAYSEDTIVVEDNHYFPLESVTPDALSPSWMRSVCYWKGVARYYHVEVDGERCAKAAWTYRHPPPWSCKIKHRIAFWRWRRGRARLSSASHGTRHRLGPSARSRSDRLHRRARLAVSCPAQVARCATSGPTRA